MDAHRINHAIDELQRDFSLEAADTPEALHEAYRLRYHTYCLERNFEPAQGDIETDEFDAFAKHAVLRHRASAEVVGTVRLVIPPRNSRGMPMQQATGLPHGRHIAGERIAEISRFCLSKRLRAASGASSALLRLSLLRGIVLLSGREDLTSWCALMEPKFLRLLQINAIYFHPIGPLVEHHGMRQPSHGRIAEVLERIWREQPSVWRFLTENGTLWQDRRVRKVAG